MSKRNQGFDPEDDARARLDAEEEGEENEENEDDEEGDEGEEDETSPDALRNRRYPCFPEKKISESKYTRLMIQRAGPSKTLETITTEAHPTLTTPSHIQQICGGGTFLVRPFNALNQMQGSASFTFGDRRKELRSIRWPEELTTSDAPARGRDDDEEEEPSSGDDPDAIEERRDRAHERRIYLMRAEQRDQDEREQRQRDWEARQQRERQEWEARLAADKAAAEARRQREDQEFQLRIKSLEIDLQSKLKSAEGGISVELEKIKTSSALELRKLEIQSKEKSTGDNLERLTGFGERVMEKIAVANPKLMEAVADKLIGEKAAEAARATIKTQAAEVMPEIVGDLTAAVYEEAVKNPAVLLDALAKAGENKPEVLERLRALLAPR